MKEVTEEKRLTRKMRIGLLMYTLAMFLLGVLGGIWLMSNLVVPEPNYFTLEQLKIVTLNLTASAALLALLAYHIRSNAMEQRNNIRGAASR